MRYNKLLGVLGGRELGMEIWVIALRKDVCNVGRILYDGTPPAKMHACWMVGLICMIDDMRSFSEIQKSCRLVMESPRS